MSSDEEEDLCAVVDVTESRVHAGIAGDDAPREWDGVCTARPAELLDPRVRGRQQNNKEEGGAAAAAAAGADMGDRAGRGVGGALDGGGGLFDLSARGRLSSAAAFKRVLVRAAQVANNPGSGLGRTPAATAARDSEDYDNDDDDDSLPGLALPQQLLWIEPLGVGRAFRERLMQELLEGHDELLGVAAAPRPVAARWSVGRLEGSIVEFERFRTVVGCLDSDGELCVAKQANYGGQDITERLASLLGAPDDLRAASLRKRARGSVAQEALIPDDAVAEAGKEPMTLPDGNTVTVFADADQRAPELMFSAEMLAAHPTLYDEQPLGRVVFDALKKRSDKDEWWSARTTALVGPPSMYPGLADRLTSEIDALVQRRDVPQHTRVHVMAPPERLLSPWIGGSIIASLSAFPMTKLFTRAMLEEDGPSGFQRLSPSTDHFEGITDPFADATAGRRTKRAVG